MNNTEYKDFGRALCAAEFPALKGIQPMGFTTVDLDESRAAQRRALAEERMRKELDRVNAEIRAEELLERGRQRFLSYVRRQAFWLKYGDVVKCGIVLIVFIAFAIWMMYGGYLWLADLKKGLSPWIK